MPVAWMAKQVLGFVLALCWFGATLHDSTGNELELRPNIVIMLIDDMGIMDTSVPFLTDGEGQGVRYPLNELYRTPNMQRMAERGIRFSNFYAMSVCSPTRISLMTGQNAARHRTTNWINPFTNNAGPQGAQQWNWSGLTSSDVTLARLLQASGYRTIHIGKGHFGAENAQGADPRNLGFDVNIAGAAFGAPGSYYGWENFGHGTERSNHAVPHLQAYHGQQIHLTEAITIEAKREISESVETNQPFFLYFPHYAVHSPFQVDRRFEKHYKDLALSPQALAFATMIEGIDKSLGDLLGHLEDLGIAKNTLVFFMGDNGSDAPLGHEHSVASEAPLRGKKGAHYEGGMRTVFMAAWGQPDSTIAVQKRLPIASGKIQNQLASVCDLFPTILELLGIASPQDHPVDGQDLARLLSGPTDSTRHESFLMHYPHGPHRSNYFTVYREGTWKLIYHYFPSELTQNSHYELFDLVEDPFEQDNLAETRPAILREMATKMAATLESQKAVYPISVDGIKIP